MYSVAVCREFVGQHFLIGGDWGAENQLHSHPYRIELQLEGAELNQYGFLVDIVEIEAVLDGLVKRYGEEILNELPEFAGLNPSIEHFSRIVCQNVSQQIRASQVQALKVCLWENQNAWASYRMER
jgi:6-pyruvoyltetrahydropterin/6-carboxytetrahydropterin synthase